MSDALRSGRQATVEQLDPPNFDYDWFNPVHAACALRDRATGRTWPLGAVMYRFRVNRSGLSVREAAGLLQKAPRWLSDVEHGRAVPTEGEFREWAQALAFPAGCVDPICVALSKNDALHENDALPRCLFLPRCTCETALWPRPCPVIAPGVRGVAFDLPDALYVPFVASECPGRGNVSRYLDGLPQDKTVIVVSVYSPVLAAALRRRGFTDIPGWEPGTGERVPCLIRRTAAPEGPR